MKKLFLSILFSIFIFNDINAQKKFSLAKYAIEASESANGMSPTVYKAKNLIVDEANGYVFQYVTATFTEPNRTELQQGYVSWGLWNTPKSKILGSFTVFIQNAGNVESSIDGNFNFNFSKMDSNENLDNIYDKQAVKNAFEDALAKMSARGAEGTEIFYAEFPQKGTTIGLFIVLGSEIKANKGKPKWKMKIGELVFDKAQSKFNFIKSK